MDFSDIEKTWKKAVRGKDAFTVLTRDLPNMDVSRIRLTELESSKRSVKIKFSDFFKAFIDEQDSENVIQLKRNIENWCKSNRNWIVRKDQDAGEIDSFILTIVEDEFIETDEPMFENKSFVPTDNVVVIGVKDFR